jgi:CheB methylesterase
VKLRLSWKPEARTQLQIKWWTIQGYYVEVTLASAAMPVRANRVYAIPPNTGLLIESYTFKVATPRISRNEQIDSLFSSLALIASY